MSEYVLTEVSGGVLRITLNRPEKRNALSLDMYSAIADALERSESDPGIRAVVLGGTGDCFTSGNDLVDFLNDPPRGEDRPAARFLAGISRASKPLIAAVNGPAIGVGTTMLLHCDLVYAGTGARFQLPFVNLGVVPEAGSSVLLPALAGHQRAAELLLLGEPFDAETAHEVGMVNRVLPDEEVAELAMAVARKLAAKPPEALRLAKMLIKRSQTEAVREAMRVEGEHFTERLASAEAREAMQAFLERRQPDFSRSG
ncbi:MAG TPA: enoyl-CoA hydratase [Gammaproteobacteria bacterium]|nr:enoyl-CoA hydratase [Gammaproteobacteria bacterium]